MSWREDWKSGGLEGPDRIGEVPAHISKCTRGAEDRPGKKKRNAQRHMMTNENSTKIAGGAIVLDGTTRAARARERERESLELDCFWSPLDDDVPH